MRRPSAAVGERWLFFSFSGPCLGRHRTGDFFFLSGVLLRTGGLSSSDRSFLPPLQEKKLPNRKSPFPLPFLGLKIGVEENPSPFFFPVLDRK